ncbi:putative DCC family thiol-disulfide oxidoreductase YuxK [Roseibium hamelinense]|uniref:Putative DCC family thiol-disulfide oxidoreductase YuxK n=1 Tax=Roseibium hamelinense TaxID=150831 RepID=A0A562SN29_9HYPH|nr:DUF393 domain-containing protein [Roseibium hamelinense]MTI44102.1 DUF393 domain-containing protein [Roseibium hamelinense]TWI82689.1 putative DCC family thiol-disulfide oxidoreductase YuxK [Roseibium hamelinense]
MITVFYDGKCGLCSREINYFKNRQPLKSIAWCDIARDPSVLSQRNILQSEALMFMRVEDETGKVHSRVDAFIVMWGQFRGWRMLARFLSLPGVHALANTAYGYFARRRFEGYGHCKVAAENDGVTVPDLLRKNK